MTNQPLLRAAFVASLLSLCACATAPPVDELARGAALPPEIADALESRDYAAAYPQVVSLADRDNHWATFLLGNYYICGRVVDFDCGKAEALFQKASRPSNSPESAELVARSRNEVAWINAACEQPGFQRKPQLALRIAAEAARDGDAYRMDTLAAAHANVADYPMAIAIQRRAIEALIEQARQEPVEAYTVTEFTRRLGQYQSAVPARFGASNAAQNCNALP